ncbi:MAG: protein-glutamate O-methyltransferase CheR [bacterium]
MKTDDLDIENIELELLLNAIYMKYSFDFRGYSRASLKRRIKHRLSMSGLKTISDLQRDILYHPDFFNTLLQDLSINVTEMFRDPSFYRALRKEVLPELRDLPHIKIWHAGCASGEEVYSMAIILKETGMYQKCRIYATDFDETVLIKAKEGVYPVERLKSYTRNYQEAGGLESFADYYSSRYDLVKLDKTLKENILFSSHNLVTDGAFGEMNLIVCRNVLIYFNRDLQDHVFKLFSDSLCPGGFLCLGSKETVQLSTSANAFTEIVSKEKIYRKTEVTDTA